MIEKYTKITSVNELKVGDKIRLYSSRFQQFFNYTVKIVKQCHGHTEIIVDKRNNKYFILDMALNKEPRWGSWVDEVYKRMD